MVEFAGAFHSLQKLPDAFAEARRRNPEPKVTIFRDPPKK